MTDKLERKRASGDVATLTMSERVNQFLSGIELVLIHHDCPVKVRQSFETQAKDYLSGCPEMVFVKRAKHLTLCPIALLLGNEPPNVPDLDFLPTGRWKRWCRPRIRFYRRRNVHLWYSFLQSKRGAAPCSEEVILLNLRKHRESMLSEDKMRGESLHLRMALRLVEPVLKRVRQRCEGTFNSILENPGLAVFPASVSASLMSARSAGGQLGQLIARLEEFERSDQTIMRRAKSAAVARLLLQHDSANFDYSCGALAPCLKVNSNREGNPAPETAASAASSDFEPVLPELWEEKDDYLSYNSLFVKDPAHQASGLKDRQVSSPRLDHLGQATERVNHSFGLAGLDRELVRMTREPRSLNIGISNFGLRQNVYSVTQSPYYEGLMEELVEERLAEEYLEVMGLIPNKPLGAMVGYILEPLKVRTITKGPAIPYYVGKRVQKAIHTAMRDMPAFRLIGRPFCVTDLIDIRYYQDKMDSEQQTIWEERGEEHVREQKWLSIDYSSATDEISATLSKGILQGILGVFLKERPELYHLLAKVLAPHEISYPVVDDVQVDSVQQTNGQLMGSILSFPILCLANLALYLFVRQFTMPNASINDLLNAVLVNGDDMIYIGTQEEWDMHIKFGRVFGLAVTPGKAYIHHRYANINSVSVDYDLSQDDSLPRRIGFLNVGLAMGLNKVLDVSAESQKDSVGWSTPRVSTIEELLSGSLYNKRAEVLKMFVSRHKVEIARECRGRNIFLPISLGGMGVPPVSKFRFHITDSQRRVASRLISFPGARIDIRPYPPGERLKLPSHGEVPVADALDEHRNFLRCREAALVKPQKLEESLDDECRAVTRARILIV